jgi:hypothetical protein
MNSSQGHLRDQRLIRPGCLVIEEPAHAVIATRQVQQAMIDPTRDDNVRRHTEVNETFCHT